MARHRRHRRHNPTEFDNYPPVRRGIPWVDIGGATVAGTLDVLAVNKAVAPFLNKVPGIAGSTGWLHNIIDLAEKGGVGALEYWGASPLGHRAQVDVAYGVGVVMGGSLLSDIIPGFAGVAPTFQQFAGSILPSMGKSAPGGYLPAPASSPGNGLTPSQISAASGGGSPVQTASSSNTNYGL